MWVSLRVDSRAWGRIIACGWHDVRRKGVPLRGQYEDPGGSDGPGRAAHDDPREAHGRPIAQGEVPGHVVRTRGRPPLRGVRPHDQPAGYRMRVRAGARPAPLPPVV